MEPSNSNKPYPPYKEKDTDISTILGEDREPFNDVIKHLDTIHGFKTVKQLDQIPKRKRRMIQLLSVVVVLGTLASIYFAYLK